MVHEPDRSASIRTGDSGRDCPTHPGFYVDHDAVARRDRTPGARAQQGGSTCACSRSGDPSGTRESPRCVTEALVHPAERLLEHLSRGGVCRVRDEDDLAYAPAQALDVSLGRLGREARSHHRFRTPVAKRRRWRRGARPALVGWSSRAPCQDRCLSLMASRGLDLDRAAIAITTMRPSFATR